ncbi:COG3740 Phage head maturation protease [uncultured Caudovirales phage]|uniref:COG3740 Phage head maturation protease n=1 Tax=uncultured Caudovirales phage TaxID=2100421 RepID=A0A6J5T637_9CAUD|nr:COG3740 Phage head maturation protease [uncultured Caudovirales phage]CAB4210623.1 COG3740 Phage head maturation protease [uncultured Caudovirales phage]CAB4223235.1 COG3740 Phage head maturation protease [uncultured Caudovirales phage]
MQTKSVDRPFELKALNEEGVFEGYGSVFGNLDTYADVVAPGAFKRSLREHKKSGTMPAMLWQHNPSEPIGVWTSMKEDSTGLYVSGQLAVKTDKGSMAYELLKMKALTGMSIGYETVQSTIDDKNKTRTLTDLNLWEVSLVTFPANGEARVQSVKAQEAIDQIKSLSDAEDFLRDSCSLSRHEATAFVSRLKAITQSDSGEGQKDDIAVACYRLANRFLRT